MPPEAAKSGDLRFLVFPRTPDWRTADFGRLVGIAVFGAVGTTKRHPSPRTSVRSLTTEAHAEADQL
jgi:hypothetical protein